MTSIYSGFNTEDSVTLTSAQGRVYIANDFDNMLVWDGIMTSAVPAGLAAPAAAPSAPGTGAGNCSAGDHLVRYRYWSSQSQYVSNPSPAITVTVAAGGQTLTFTVGTHVVASSDVKCDQIIIEMTAVNSSAYYVAGYIRNTAAQSLAFSTVDSALIQGDLAEGFGNEKPPLFSYPVIHKGRMFGAGTTARTRTVTATGSSATVSGTNFSTQWAGRLIRIGSDAVAYEILSATTTAITLTTPYTGTTGVQLAVIFSKLPNRLYWTDPFYVEGWNPQERARDMLQRTSDELRGYVSFGGDLVFFGRHSGERLVFTEDPGTLEGQIIPFVGNRGAHSQRTICEAEGELYVWDRQGMFRLEGIKQQHISKPIDVLLTEMVDFAYLDNFHSVFDPTDRVVMWFFTAIGDTKPYYAACYEVETGRWFIHQWRQAITASAIVPDTNGQMRAWLSDENGFSWFYGIEGGFDGVPSGAPSVVTVTAGATATSIPVAEALTTVPTLEGAVIYNPTTDEEAVVSTNTATEFTMISPGFTTPPSDADVLYIGSIPFEYRTKWFAGSGQETKKQTIYFVIKLYPGPATGKLRVYFYGDFSSTPSPLTALSSDQWPNGVTPNVAGNYWEVDLDGGDGAGYLPIPTSSDWNRVVQARIINDIPTGELRILSAYFQVVSNKNEIDGT